MSQHQKIHKNSQPQLLTIIPVEDGVFRANPCPLCGHMECFTLYPATNTFKCFACEKQGDILDIQPPLSLLPGDQYLISYNVPPKKRHIKKLIGFSGTHGTGKTTASMVRAAALKTENPTKRIGLLTETAETCPLPINEKGTESSQLWIFTAHIAREIELAARCDLVVCDRTPVDAIAYTYVLGFEALALGMMSTVREYMDRHYQQIILRRAKENPYAYADGRRTTEAVFRQNVETELMHIYRKLGLNGILQYV